METMSITLPADDNLQPTMEKLYAEGWRIIAGCVPQVTYALFREPAAHAEANITIDESKVFVVKAGEAVPGT